MMGGIVRRTRRWARRGGPLQAATGFLAGLAAGPLAVAGMAAVAIAVSILAALYAMWNGGPDWFDGPEPPSLSEGRTILLVTVDTLRADHLGAWGDEQVDTPALDAFLAEALVFESAFAPAPITTPSLGSILTAMMPRAHGALNNGYDLTAQVSFVPKLRQLGFRTAAFLPTFLADKSGFKRGFDVYEHPPMNAPPFPGEEIVRRALAFLDANEPVPCFVWVHLIEPHSPYDAGALLEHEVLERAGLADVVVPARLRHETYSEHEALAPPDVDLRRALYRAEVERVDLVLAPLLVRASDPARATWTVFAADHGEELHDERDYAGHAAWLDDAMLRVPLAFHATDGAFGPGRRRDPASLLDVAPTLFGALGASFETGGGGLDLSRETAPADRLLVHETFAPEAFRDKVAARRGARTLLRIEGEHAEGDAGLAPDLDAWIERHTDPAKHRRPALDARTIRALEAMGYAQSGR